MLERPSPLAAPFDLSRRAAVAVVAVGALAFFIAAGATLLVAYWVGDGGVSLDSAYIFQRIYQAGLSEPACRTLLITEQGDGLLAGRHLEPVLAAFVPLVRLAPRMEALLLAQLALLTLTSVPAYLLGERLTGDRLTATLLALTWLAQPLTWRLTQGDLRTFTVAVLFMALAFAAVATRRLGLLAFSVALALMCREEPMYFMAALAPAALAQGLLGQPGQAPRTPDRRSWLLVAVLLGLPLLWAPVVVHALGGLSTHVAIEALPERLLQRLSGQAGPGAANDISAGQALSQLWAQVGPGLLVAPLAPLWALPLALNWVGIQASGGLARPEIQHYLAPAAAALPAIYAGAAGNLARLSGRGPFARALAALLLIAGLATSHALVPDDLAQRVLRVASGGDWPSHQTQGPWALVALIPDGAPTLADGGLAPLLGARRLLYNVTEHSDPEMQVRIAAACDHALLWSGSPWVALLESEGYAQVQTSGAAVLLRKAAPLGPPVCLGGEAR